jgi:RNA polymerase sigma-70 factor, ECF subfamily
LSTNSISPRGARRGPSSQGDSNLAPVALALLQRAQGGDRDAYAQLYRTFQDPVTRYVTVRMRDRDRDAIDDLVQDTFTDALAELPTAILDVRGWFIIQAAKACNRYDWSRRRYVRAAYAVRDEATHTAATPIAAQTPARRPGRMTFVHAIARLTDDQRRAIQLCYLDGYPRDAAARQMGRSVEAVRSLQRRALLRLQLILVGPAVTA